MYINIHTHNLEKNDNLFVYNQGLNKFDVNIKNSSVGIHPWKINKNEYINQLEKLSNILENSNLFAIGECGLDKKIDIDLELQKEIFINQLEFSEKYNKPIIIHCVKAYQDILQILKQIKFKNYVIFHGFSANLELANQILKNENYYLSFGHFLFKNTKTQNTFMNIPLEKCFLETDNHDYSIQEIYNKACEIRNIDLEDFKKTMICNYNKITNID